MDIAIRVCRQSGYNKHALDLAEQYHKHQWYLKLQIEDLKGYQKALDYISKLDFSSAEQNMKKYGSALMRHLPDQTTDLLKKLCTDFKPHNRPLLAENNEPYEVQMANPEQFLHLFVNNSQAMVTFLEYMIVERPEASGSTVYTTLLEHYLHLYSETEDKVQVENKIMDILRNNLGQFDEDQALILCQRHAFSKGSLYLFERKGFFGEILRFHIEHRGDLESAIQTCRRFGPQDPNLWIQALQSISREGECPPEYLSEILDQIESNRLMSPLLVLQTLAKSSTAGLGLLRDFLIRLHTTEEKLMKEDEIVIEQYRHEAQSLQEKIKALKTSSVVFQVSKCSACSHNLELPSVHFLCQHSFHKHCFQSYSESESECPACHADNTKILDIIKSQDKNRDNHDEFHHNLDKAENSFAVIADYFGRGLFRKPIQLNELTNKIKEMESEKDFVTSNLDVGPGAEARRRMEESLRFSKMEGEGFSEARLRSSQRSEAEVKYQSEARMRSVQASQGQTSYQSEARMRSVQASKAEVSHQSEARLRSVQRSEAEVGRPKSDARMRLTEHKNPFDEDSKNPFEETSPKNPFEEESSKNPFGEPKDENDDYDNSLNPFGES